jgi:predicted metal-dependent peptidase
MSDIPQEELDKALTRAKIALMSNIKTVFFSHVMLRMEHVFDADIPTAATDGRKVMYNPDFFMGLSKGERVGLVLHEVLHPAFLNMQRQGERDPQRFNAACDYANNLIIVDAGIKLPEGGLLDEKYRDMRAEEIYDLLPVDVKPDHDDLKLQQGDPDEFAEEMDQILIDAAIATQKKGEDAWGSVPESLRRHIDTLLKPTVKWNVILRPWMRRVNKGNKKTYRRINRRFSDEIIRPTYESDALKTGAIISDVSGSVSQEQWQAWTSEAWHVLKTNRFEKIWFGQFDCEFTVEAVKNEKEFLAIPFTGGGGTNPTPALKWCLKERPDWVVIFTDGYFRDIELRLPMPVVWVVHGNDDWRQPFGKKIIYELPTL